MGQRTIVGIDQVVVFDSRVVEGVPGDGHYDVGGGARCLE